VPDNGIVDITSFTRRLHGLSADEIGAVAAALRAERDTPDGEVTWWRATIEVTGAIKRHRCTREASLAAHRASTAVLDAARTAGIDDDDHRGDVTAVARAAGEAARLQVLLACAAAIAPSTWALLQPWTTVPMAA
jgi:hypothetical protein